MGVIYICCKSNSDLLSEPIRNEGSGHFLGKLPQIDSELSESLSKKSHTRQRSIDKVKPNEEEKLSAEMAEGRMIQIQTENDEAKPLVKETSFENEKLENEKIIKFLKEQHLLEKKILDDNESEERKIKRKDNELKRKENLINTQDNISPRKISPRCNNLFFNEEIKKENANDNIIKAKNLNNGESVKKEIENY